LVQEVRSPATCGLWRAHVLLPSGLVPQLSPGQFSDVLRHELTHVRQRDYLKDRLAAIACRLVWFHPAAWFAHRRLRWERELACDQTVTGNGVEERLQYAESLTKLARWLYLADSIPPSGIGFCSSSSRLATRVKSLLNEPQSYSPSRQAITLCLIASLGAITSYFLPSMGLTLHWRPTAPSVGPQSRIVFRERKSRRAKHFSVATTKRAVPSETGLPFGPAISEKKLADFLPPSTSPAIPILDASPDPEAAVEETSSEESEVKSVVLHPVWDEVQLPPSTNTPTWRKIAISAITAGLGMAADEDPDKSIPRPRGKVSHPR
jgi:BlaR1 peptidase M56